MAALWNKANYLATQGRQEEAIACFNRTLAIDPRHAKAWYNKGTCLAKIGRVDEAIDCFDRALSSRPTICECLAEQSAG